MRIMESIASKDLITVTAILAVITENAHKGTVPSCVRVFRGTPDACAGRISMTVHKIPAGTEACVSIRWMRMNVDALSVIMVSFIAELNYLRYLNVVR